MARGAAHHRQRRGLNRCRPGLQRPPVAGTAADSTRLVLVALVLVAKIVAGVLIATLASTAGARSAGRTSAGAGASGTAVKKLERGRRSTRQSPCPAPYLAAAEYAEADRAGS